MKSWETEVGGQQSKERLVETGRGRLWNYDGDKKPDLEEILHWESSIYTEAK